MFVILMQHFTILTTVQSQGKCVWVLMLEMVHQRKQLQQDFNLIWYGQSVLQLLRVVFALHRCLHPTMPVFFAATANDVTANYYTTLNATSFTVGLTNNANASLFYFAAFKNAANSVYVGTFNGDGVDDRNITDPNFEPDFVYVKQNSASVGVFNTTETWGDYASVTTAAADAPNNIQDIISTGFQVGNSSNVNANAVASYYFAFGGAPDPASSGSFLMQSGNYTGNGVAGKIISLSFKPDLVIIKANATQFGVWTTSLDTNLTHYFGSATAGYVNGITAMGATSFTVGSDNTVNQNLTTYEYIAFGNATSPHSGAGASDFVVGKYIGNAVGTGKVIDHLGIAPSMVVSGRDTGAFAPVWRSSSMGDNNAGFFTATINSTDGTVFKTLNSDGFTAGLSTSVNVAGVNSTFLRLNKELVFLRLVLIQEPVFPKASQVWAFHRIMFGQKRYCDGRWSSSSLK